MVKTGCKNNFVKDFKRQRDWINRCLLETHTFSLISGQYQLTSNPCFSDGTHTSLLAAQSAWLAAEKTELEVGEPGLAPDDRKWVTSLVLFPVALDMVLLAKVRKKMEDKKEIH